MKLTVLGNSPAAPNPGQPCAGYLLSERGTILLECGHGIAARLQQAIRLPDLQAIVISHMHADHFLDLVPLGYVIESNGFPPIPLHLPPGGIAVLQNVEGTLGLGDTFFRSWYQLSEYDPSQGLDLDGLHITMAPTRHWVQGWAMRFAGDTGSLFYSADTAWTDALVSLAQDASIALIESTEVAYSGPDEAQGHLTAKLAGVLARTAHVKQLVLTHYPSNLAAILGTQASSTFGGPICLAAPGATYAVS